MTERPRRDQSGPAWDQPERRLTAADFDTAPFAGLPARRHARDRISTPRHRPEQPLPKRGRKLSRAERRRIQDEYRAKTAVPLPARHATPASSRGTWAMKLGGLLAISVVLLTLGSARFFGAAEDRDGTPTAVVPVVAIASPTAAVVAMEPPTPTPEPPQMTPTPNPLFVGKVVCLDPGHGGSDRGYEREANDVAPAMEEAHYNLAYAKAVRLRLESLGFTVVLTRYEDHDVNAAGTDVNGDGKTGRHSERAKLIDELQARIDICNAANADLLVSMHINGFPDSAASGFETWYNAKRPFWRQNRLFATLAHEELERQMARAGYNPPARGVHNDAEAHVNIGRDAFDSYVITGPEQPGQIVPSAMPGAIVEVLFISNDEDAAFLASNEGRNAVVTAYEQAIRRFFIETADDPSPVASPAATEEP